MSCNTGVAHGSLGLNCSGKADKNNSHMYLSLTPENRGRHQCYMTLNCL